ncbi:MAG TPA: ribose 5-phosphate isomerase B, partial [Coriobacteriia bacterium]|nr:ribose 5-phosphate isomerase B [Coriobacteriia bacterium]
IGSDHAGFELKEQVKAHLLAHDHTVLDVGTNGSASVDYPDFAQRVGEAVARGDVDFGVLVCGSGLGMSIAANKIAGVRAVQVMDAEMAKMSRLHNDANVVTLAGRYLEPERAEQIVDTFLSTAFEGGRHQQRIDKITELERDSVTE